MKTVNKFLNWKVAIAHFLKELVTLQKFLRKLDSFIILRKKIKMVENFDWTVSKGFPKINGFALYVKDNLDKDKNKLYKELTSVQ